MRNLHSILAIFIVSLIFIIGYSGEQKSFAQQVSVSGGIFGIDDERPVGQVQFEYWSRKKSFILSRFFGTLLTTSGSLYTYGGIAYAFPIMNLWLKPNFAMGLYLPGRGMELGGILEFRSGLELAVQLPNNSHIGISVHHISNGGLYHHNSGKECVAFIYTLNF